MATPSLRRFLSQDSSGSSPENSESSLFRLSQSSLGKTQTLTASQTQVKEMVATGFDQMTDWTSLTAMVTGGLCYRLGRIGFLASADFLNKYGKVAGFLVKAGSYGVGLAEEVVAFEITNRTLLTLSPHPSPLPKGEGVRKGSPSPLEGEGGGEGGLGNLWLWSGPRGLWEGFKTSFVHFGALKGMGRLSHGQNLAVQHLLQSSGMVLGHQITGRLGWTPMPEGDLAEQLFHSEITNLQIGVSMALGHILLGGRLQSMEKGLDLVLQSPSFHSPSRLRQTNDFFSPRERAIEAMAMVGNGPIPEIEIKGNFLEPPPFLTTGSGEGKSTEREVRYQRFISQRVEKILNHFEQGHDRGLVVSPMGLRDMTEALIRRLMEDNSPLPFFPETQDRRILLVVQGKENLERWRKRMESVVGERQAGHREQDIWKKNNITVQLASVHTLSRLHRARLREFMKRSGLVILDKEHHVRPILDDPQGKERDRFIRVLVEGGFLTPEFERTPHPENHLLGLTETVTEGAGGIYGGEAGLIFSETLPHLLIQGFVNRPEVRVIAPNEFKPDVPVDEAWRTLDLPERVRHTVKILETLRREKGEDDRLPRTVLYTGSREEAMALAAALEELPLYQKKVALLISGDESLETRREKELPDFLSHGTRRVAIHVETMVEGVDEFQKNPVDLVIFGAVEYVGGLRYALQSAGAHLGAGEKVPIFIDQAGMFLRHPDLTAFDPSIYILEDGRLRRGFSLTKSKEPTIRTGVALKGTETWMVDLFGEEVGTETAESLHRLAPRFDRARVAMRMGVSEGIVHQMWAGTFVSNSRITMEALAKAMDLTPEGKESLLSSWASDRARYFEKRSPVSDQLSEKEKTILRKVRWGLFRHYGGIAKAVQGPQAITFERYLGSGQIPLMARDQQNFFDTLAKVIGGPGAEEKGREFLREHLGKAFLREYWQPNRISDLDQLSTERIEEWFETVAISSGLQPEALSEIVWQFHRHKEDFLGSPTPLRVGEERKENAYGRFLFRRWGTGQFE